MKKIILSKLSFIILITITVVVMNVGMERVSAGGTCTKTRTCSCSCYGAGEAPVANPTISNATVSTCDSLCETACQNINHTYSSEASYTSCPNGDIVTDTQCQHRVDNSTGCGVFGGGYTLTCDANNYLSENGLLCNDCPDGKVSPVGSTSSTQCVDPVYHCYACGNGQNARYVWQNETNVDLNFCNLTNDSNCPGSPTDTTPITCVGNYQVSAGDCKITCSAGTHVAKANGSCVSCEGNTISSSHSVVYGETSSCVPCSSDLPVANSTHTQCGKYRCWVCDDVIDGVGSSHPYRWSLTNPTTGHCEEVTTRTTEAACTGNYSGSGSGSNSGGDSTSVAVTDITISPKPAEVEVGETIQLTATVTPSTANQTVNWRSSDPNIASVDNNGVVTGKVVGTVTITATTQDGTKSDTAQVTVKAEGSGTTTHNITFNCNGGTGTMESKSVNFGQTITLPTNSCARIGYTFTGWNTSSNGSGTAYADGATIDYTLNDNLELFAQWTRNSNTYVIHYDANDANGGTGTMTDTVATVDVEGTLKANTFKYSGHTFDGWKAYYKDSNGNWTPLKKDNKEVELKNKAKFTNLMGPNEEEVTLFAQWKVVNPKTGIVTPTAIIGGLLLISAFGYYLVKKKNIVLE